MKLPYKQLYFLLLLIPFCLGYSKSLQVGHTTVELISENNGIVPGQSFDVAISFLQEPHWHIYWKNPGSSGLPLEITWDLPNGIEAGEIQWPAPKRIELQGLVTYGYENVVTFIIPMTATKELKEQSVVELKAELFWLICKEVCLPGEASVTLSLPVTETVSESKNAVLFEEARSTQPKPLPDNWTVSSLMEQEQIIIEIIGGSIPEDLYFYADQEGFIDANAKQEVSFPSTNTLHLNLIPDRVFLSNPTVGRSISGVLQSQNESWAISSTQTAYTKFGKLQTVSNINNTNAQWSTWSQEKVQDTLQKGRPVFVDFTATWCLICQVNKKVALRTDATTQLFEDYDIVALTADWTSYDPEITTALEEFNRSGVPLYLLYLPNKKVRVLPQNLTSSLIKEIVEQEVK